MIQTPRLLIRPWKEADAPAFYELSQDAGFTLFPITHYRQESVASALAWIRENPHKYAVLENSTGELIGMGGLMPWMWEEEALTDVTYRLRESAWGQGYGQELARALVRYGVEELKLNNLSATITPDNVASKKIVERLGFTYHARIILKGVETDLYRLGF